MTPPSISSPARRLRRPGSLSAALALLVTSIVIGPAAVRAARAGDQGAATKVTVTLTPAAIPADRSRTDSNTGSDSTVVVAVEDAAGHPVTDETVTLSTDGDVTFGNWSYGFSFRAGPRAANNGDGTYSITVQASATPGPNTITATATAASVSGTATLTETAPGPSRIMYSFVSARGDASFDEGGSSRMPADGATSLKWDMYLGSSAPVFGVGLPGAVVRYASPPDGDVGFSDPQLQPGPDPQPSCRVSTLEEAGKYVVDQFAGQGGSLNLMYCGITITASTTVGAEAPRATIDLPPGTPASIAPSTRSFRLVETEVVTLAFRPDNRLVADGASQRTALVTVTRDGRPVADETILFASFEEDSSDPADLQIGSVTNHGDGTYSAVVTASNTVGFVKVKATATKEGAQTTQVLEEVAGPPGDVDLVLDPPVVQADGVSPAQAYLTLVDRSGSPIIGQKIDFSSDGGLAFGEVTEGEARKCQYCTPHGNGIYTVDITTTKKAGPVTITAVASPSGARSSAVLLQTAAPTKTVSVKLDRASLPADGTSTTLLTARLTDASGNPVPIENLAFSTSGASKIGPVTNHRDGTYTATLTASSQPGNESIKATARKSGAFGAAALTLVRG